MFEIIVVTVIVAVVAFMAGRSFFRTITGRNDGCVCSTNCPGCVRKGLEKTDQEQGMKR